MLKSPNAAKLLLRVTNAEGDRDISLECHSLYRLMLLCGQTGEVLLGQSIDLLLQILTTLITQILPAMDGLNYQELWTAVDPSDNGLAFANHTSTEGTMHNPQIMCSPKRALVVRSRYS